MFRSLRHYWRINLAVMLGAAIATAVLTGALLVGDSVRGSLRDLTLDRLGAIDHVLVAERFFDEKLARRISISPVAGMDSINAVPAILLSGSATHAKTRTLANRINLLGIDRDFIRLYHTSLDSLDQWKVYFHRDRGQPFPSLVINQALAHELGAAEGDQVLLSFEQRSEIHRESLLGSRQVDDIVKTSRFAITKIIPDRGIGRFGIRSEQSLALNAYIPMRKLQRSLGEHDRVNALFLANSRAAPIDALQSALQQSLTFEDLGVKIDQEDGYLNIESSEVILSPYLANHVTATTAKLQLPTLRSYTYLANRLTYGDKFIPYSTVAALDLPIPAGLPGFVTKKNGGEFPPLKHGEIVLNEWAADDLGIRPGEELEMSYYVVGPREELLTETTSFRLKGIVEMTGLGADPMLTPDFPGIHSADDMQGWDPPFPVDLSLIREKDERYWDDYRAAPKAFISLEDGQELWSSRFGNLTAIRAGSKPETEIDQIQSSLESELRQRLQPENMGLLFQPVKEQGLRAARGATDFSGLFVGFSFFLILAAALLVGMLFRLGIEQRSQEIGIYLAVGHPLPQVRSQLMRESALVAGAGCLLGLAGAVGYGALMMHGLRTWWLDAVGSPYLFLHVNFGSLLLGYLISVAVTFFAIWWTIRQLGKIPAPALLRGVTELSESKRPRFARILAISSAIMAAILILLALVTGATSSAEFFFGSGALLLISGLSLFSIWLRRIRHRQEYGSRIPRILQLAADYTARNPGRSMLSATLVGAASFVIVAVAANRRDFGPEALQKNSGTGGFTLVAESDIPIHQDLNSDEGRFELGIDVEDDHPLNSTTIFPMRLLAGEDASCLNLYKPERPSILGITQEQIDRGGFAFQETVEELDNPWQLLESKLEPGVIPAIGDYNSVRWILHLGLGQDLVVQNEAGQEIKLRLVGLLQKSIFQREVIISEKNFLEQFPSSASGYASFLIETPGDQADAVVQQLESSLSDHGFDATSTLERLQRFQAVENTYLSVFQTLGGLGLLLGTLGLGILLVRNIIERRKELATLRAFGFRRGLLSTMLLAENSFLILAGIAIGAISALFAVSPHIFSSGSNVPWLSLALTLLLVLIAGLLASLIAVAFALRTPLLPALKAE